ncbi:MAG: D-alanine--D-alanine ligase [Candidatus Auribacterota bacterium]
MSGKRHVGVLMGGPSREYDISLKSGGMILNHIDRSKYDVTPVVVRRDGSWSIYCSDCRVPDTDIRAWLECTPGIVLPEALERIANSGISVFVNVMHGAFGEDGTVQAILDALGISYTGSGVLASSLAMDKIAYGYVLKGAGIRMAQSVVVPSLPESVQKLGDEIGVRIGYPCVLKTPSSGSSIGVQLCPDRQSFDLIFEDLFTYDGKLLIEKYIPGREFTCAVLGNAYSQDVTVLNPIEIVTQNAFFDFDAKYSDGKAQEITDPDIPDSLRSEIMKIGVAVHNLIGCDGISRTDMIADASGIVYVLETNTLPGMTAQSLVPRAACAAGYTLPGFIDTLIGFALNKKNADSCVSKL